MRCPACRKQVVFGSQVGKAWDRIHAGEWLHGGRPPALGKLGDCPACGVRLEWEPGEQLLQDPDRTAAPRVHLSALREAGARFDGREIWMRALVLEREGAMFLSDSWRARGKETAESDLAMLERLAKEQRPRIEATFASEETRVRYRESARSLDATDSSAAWLETEGLFRATPDGGTLRIRSISSIWPPKD